MFKSYETELAGRKLVIETGKEKENQVIKQF